MAEIRVNFIKEIDQMVQTDQLVRAFLAHPAVAVDLTRIQKAAESGRCNWWLWHLPGELANAIACNLARAVSKLPEYETLFPDAKLSPDPSGEIWLCRNSRLGSELLQGYIDLLAAEVHLEQVRAKHHSCGYNDCHR